MICHEVDNAGALPVAMADMFPAQVRFSVMAIGSNVTLALVGGTAPLGCHLAHQDNGPSDRSRLDLVVLAVVTFLVNLTVQPQPEEL